MADTGWQHFRILLRDFQGTHIAWTDPNGGEHLRTFASPHESAGFIFRWVQRWRAEAATHPAPQP